MSHANGIAPPHIMQMPIGARLRALAAAPPSFSDWPLLAKFALVPALATLLLVAVAAIGIVALQGARSDTASIVAHDMQGNDRLAQAAVRFQRADADLYRLLVDKAADPTSTEVAPRANAIRAELRAIATELRRLRAERSRAGDHARFDAVLAGIGRYEEAVDVVTTMLDVDFAAAVAMLQPFRKHAAGVLDSVRDLTARGMTQSRVRADAFSARVGSVTLIFLLVAVSAVGGTVAATWLIGRSTVSSIRAIAEATRRATTSGETGDISSLRRGDELGMVVEALRFFRDTSLERERLRVEAAEEARKQATARREAEAAEAARDAERQRQADAERRRALAAVAHQFETRVVAVIEAVGASSEALGSCAREVQESVAETGRESKRINEVSDDVAASMRVATRATEALTKSIGEINSQVASSAHATATALDHAVEAKARVTRLSEETRDIDAIVQLIDGIAKRTNLLALNASIEAMRAGEAGYGFAVVAQEVKDLAGQSGRAAGQVREQIVTVQKLAGDVVAATDTINSSVQDLKRVADFIVGAMRRQAQATGEIAHSVSVASSKGENLVEVAAAMREAATSNSAAANAMRAESASLQNEFERLRSDSQSFAKQIAAA